MQKNILITGLPHAGKSTILDALIMPLKNKCGFLTREIRLVDQRVGFEIIGSDGAQQLFAHVNIKSPIKVSKYGVDIAALERIIPNYTNFKFNDILYLDEIGQMELYSPEFKILAEKYLNSPNIFIGTISQIYTDKFIDSIKRRNDVIIYTITPENRDGQLNEIKANLARISENIVHVHLMKKIQDDYKKLDLPDDN